MAVLRESFGQLKNGTAVDLFTLNNEVGLTVKIINFGGIVVSIEVPDRNGILADVALGFDSLEKYETKNASYFGALIGRVGNRLSNAAFLLNKKSYKVGQNAGENSLHGGITGFDKVVWQAEPEGENCLKLTHTSPDGDEGYPGKLTVTVRYRLTADNDFRIEYQAETDAPTPVNLTWHGYFNLKGHDGGDVKTHEVCLNALQYTPVSEGLIPTGELLEVANTPLDFTTPHLIGARFDELTAEPIGYDHNLVLCNQSGRLELAARVFEPETGRLLEVLTTEPGVQFYTGNFLDGTCAGKNDTLYQQYSGFCLETQHFPDSPNRPEFPSIILEPGVEYSQVTVYRFSVK